MPIADDTTTTNAPVRPRRGVTLPEPVTVARFWKNRAHDAIVVELSTFENRNVVDVRTNVMSHGRLVPTPKGISLAVLRAAGSGKSGHSRAETGEGTGVAAG